MSDDIIILNFDNEEDGATEWLEEAQGLSPNYATDCEVDATTCQAGVGSLLFKTQWFYEANRAYEYSFPNLGASFTYKMYFKIDSPNLDDFGSIDLFGLFGTECVALVFASYRYAFGQEEPYELIFEAMDNNFNMYEVILSSSTSCVSGWNLVKIAVGETTTQCYLNSTIVGTWAHLMEEPFLGINILYTGYNPW